MRAYAIVLGAAIFASVVSADQNNEVMEQIEIHLQEGFDLSHFVVEIDGEVAREFRDLSTDVTIGLAAVVPLDVALGSDVIFKLIADIPLDARFVVSSRHKFVTVSIVEGAILVAFADRLPGYL